MRGWVGFVDYPGVRSWLVEAGRKKEEGKERTRYLDSSLYVHESQRLNFPLVTISRRLHVASTPYFLPPCKAPRTRQTSESANLTS